MNLCYIYSLKMSTYTKNCIQFRNFQTEPRLLGTVKYRRQLDSHEHSQNPLINLTFPMRTAVAYSRIFSKAMNFNQSAYVCEISKQPAPALTYTKFEQRRSFPLHCTRFDFEQKLVHTHRQNCTFVL